MFDRRSAFRLDRQMVIKYEMESDKSQLYLTAYSDNISSNGICIRTGKKIADGQKVKLRIHLPDLDSRVQVEAQITWTRQYAASGMYLSGLAFTSSENEIVTIIDQWIMADKFGVKSV